ncbi:MetQ/NlpA family ABC transporter substrate-binding protein [Nesterenkonia sp. LB17]|uniref:MetQ/NlpA family ABC transporter substrate-binding protein n=1 Tax=unclassified Nesterenkonia TaxID=2629769 RepID=UPI001F4D26F1|nr:MULTISPECIES: MetQ/NlpA family ABC transporter substrate-binding protein [unclassified Nesterenkonia]MCH8560108.1 MetQ/NlpA family ABC transporter substrate-binding protein [Nesterenkonia sp. DZ6]MCH8564179.1 MetQ/NlpA family ABC transporter substrate-binding protein [Nesterenkonia sp. LB17]MCH8569808.1 MetQ/NlpA family ABC transporter substrate-binding protein [Nesterenkonia sp. AY15]
MSTSSAPTLSRRRVLSGSLGMAALLGVGSLTSGCGLAGGAGADRSLRLVVTENAPFQEPTRIAQRILEADGWEFNATYVTDIIQPNHAVSNGEYDVNFFQNISYLRQFNADNDLDIEPIFFMFEQPSGIYSAQHDSLEELPDGAQIALPVDTANNGRGIRLLARGGLIEIDESKPVAALSVRDITANPKDLQFIEVDQQSVGQIYADVDAVFGFARLLAEIDVLPDEVLIMESAEEALPFALAVCARPGFREEQPERFEALKAAYHSAEVREWYGEYLDGLLNPAFDRDIDAAWKQVNDA